MADGRIMVIGGGAIGLSVAYHLGRAGVDDVLLVERNRLGSGTSWHAAGIVGPLGATQNLTELARYGVDLFRRLEFPEDWDHAEPMLEAGIRRVPVLQEFGISRFMNGPESFTPNTRQITGRAPGLANFYVAAGFNSIGIMSSAGVGRAMAEWVTQGRPERELWSVDIQRFLPGALCHVDTDQAVFPFASSRQVTINGADVRASRISYVGEQGWELMIPVEQAGRVLDSVTEEIVSKSMGFAGHFCLDSCRLEKGYVHWGHDVGPDDDPLSVGLMFAVRMTGGFDFIGKALCMGYVVASGDGQKENGWAIEIAGERFPLRVLEHAPYDPGGSRMRT